MNFPGAIFVPKSGALGGIRTHDLCLRRAALYPLSYKRIYEPLEIGYQRSGQS